MEALAPYISPLSFDVPSPAPQRNLMDKISAKHVKSTLEKRERKQRQTQNKVRGDEEKRARKSRAHSESGALEFKERLQELDDKIKEINLKADEKLISKQHPRPAKIEGKRSKRIEKIEQKRIRLIEESMEQRLEKDEGPGDSKERKKIERMEYIVIEVV